MRSRRRGLLLVLLSAMAFGTSGPFARALLDVGWSAGAAVLVRVTGAAVVLALLAALTRADQVRRLLHAPRTVVVYGVVAVAGVQVCFFSAVRTLSVGVALLLEYLAPVLVVAWVWMRTARRPSRRTLTGGGLALAGTVAVLDVHDGARIDPVGVMWALAAAACLACYFVVLGGESPNGDAPDPVALAAAGMVVGSVAVLAAALLGVLPVTFGEGTTVLAGQPAPVWVPVLALVLGSTVLAYLAGAAGLALLGATAGSVVSLSEVLFAVLAAWLLLDQSPTAGQALGATFVIAGVVLAQTGASAGATEPTVGATAATAGSPRAALDRS